MPAPRSAPPVIPATLVARGLRSDRAGRTVLDGVSVTVGPHSCIGVTGPNGVGKSTLLRLLAGLDEPDAGSVTLDPPSATVGYLAQEHERVPGETVRALLDPAHRGRRRRGRAGGGRHRPDRGHRRRRRALRGGPRAVHRPGRRRPRRPDRRPPRRPGGRTVPGRPGDVDAVRGPGGEGGAGRRRAVAVRRHPARRAHQRPRLRGPAAAAGLGGRTRPADSCWCRTTATSSSDRRRPCSSSTSTPGRPGSTAAAGRRTRRSGSPPAATPMRPSPPTSGGARSSRPGPSSSASGPPRAWPGSPRPEGQRPGPARLPDRPHREAGGQGPPGRSGAGVARRGGQALGRVGAPLHHRGGRPGRGRGGPAVGGRRRAGHVPPGPGGPADRLGGPGGPDRTQRVGEVTLVGAMLGTVPLAAGERWLGPGVVPGVLGQDRRALGGDRDLVREVCDRCGVDPVRGPIAAGQVRPGGRAGHPAGRDAVAGRADPGRARRLPGTGRQRPGPRRAHQPLDLPAIEQLESASAASPARSSWSPTTVGCWSRST